MSFVAWQARSLLQRTIRKLAWSLKNVQHRRVTEENCEEWGVFKNKGSEGKEMVKLNFG